MTQLRKKKQSCLVEVRSLRIIQPFCFEHKIYYQNTNLNLVANQFLLFIVTYSKVYLQRGT